MTDIEKIVKKDFSGAVSVRIGETTMFEKAFGYADRPNGIPNELDTKFATASAGKFFVSIGIMQLIEREQLNLEETIGEILDFDLEQIDPGITIQQLLSHTSGIPDYFDESVMDEYAELWTDFPNYKIRKSVDLLPLFVHKPMMYPAGARFQYNNSGYVVLDQIIEKKTGLLFDKYLQQNVFDICKMNSTGYYELDRLPEKCSSAYIYDESRKEFYTNIFSVDAKGTGAGGAYTTVLDISKLWDCLLAGKLLSKKSLDEMLSLKASNEKEFYGYGVWLRKTSNSRFIPFFQGCDPGVSFISSFDLERKRNITIVSNLCNNVWELESKITELLDNV